MNMMRVNGRPWWRLVRKGDAPCKQAFQLRKEAALGSLNARLLAKEPEFADHLDLLGQTWTGTTGGARGGMGGVGHRGEEWGRGKRCVGKVLGGRGEDVEYKQGSKAGLGKIVKWSANFGVGHVFAVLHRGGAILEPDLCNQMRWSMNQRTTRQRGRILTQN